MEVADNQHPIDLSRKCAYYEHPQRYTKSHVSSSSRPLPDLIPISLLQDTTKPLASFRKYYDDDRRSPFLNCMQSCNQSLLSFQSKQRSMTRKELSRQRSTSPATSIGTAFSSGFSSKIRKSNSETRIPFLRIDDSPLNRSSANYLSVPLHRKTMPSLLSTTVTRPSSKAVRNYDDQDAGPFHHDSLCVASSSKYYNDRRYDDEVSSSSTTLQSKKYIKQGPGVSVSTIQSLRKLLDKRKSMQKDS